jgi:hypothetical protein
MSRRFSQSAWLAALALLALSTMSASAWAGPVEPVEGVHTFNCYGRYFGQRSCFATFRRGVFHPHVINVPALQSADDIAAAEARDRRWVARCRPQVRQDQYGMPRYNYAAPGCEFGLVD